MKKIFCAICVSLLTASVANADLIAEFNFDAGSLVATNGAFGTASDISLGTAWAAANDQLERALTTEATSGDATDAVNQVGFTFTVAGLGADEVLDIESATINYLEDGIPRNTVRYNYFAGTTAALTAPGQIDPPAAPADPLTTTFNNSLDLVTGLSNGDTVTLSFGARDNETSGTIEIDNLSFDGAVRNTAVPEPSACSLLGLGAIVILAQRRKRS